MGVIRTFVAVTLGGDIERSVAAAVGELRSELGAVRWVRAETAHLTLKFYGDVEEAAIPALIEALEQAARAVEPFPVAIAGGGAFPSPGRARVLWLGVEDPAAALPRLATAVEAASSPLGYPAEDRPYTPHLTVGRARGPVIRDAAAALERLRPRRFGQTEVRELVLFRSDLSPSGPSYTPLARLPLGAPTPEPLP